ncbi:MAG: ATP-binding protein [Gammaproteobacteria bacterium]|jgi:predicted AAA+ superfamily ATPase
MPNVVRLQQQNIEKWLFKQKIIVVYGARQVGKTTMVQAILKKFKGKSLYLDCDIVTIRQSLEQEDPLLLKRMLGDVKLLIIDEAQRVQKIGTILKLLHDHCPEIQVIATGSSSFDLANKTNESLIGRGLEFVLYPLALGELTQIYNNFEIQGQLDNLLLYGSYPEIIMAARDDAIRLLNDLTNKYLYKDILEFENIKKPDLIIKLLQLLAFQVGNEVSRNELAVTLQVSRATINRYIDLLEKAFVIFRLTPFSRNLRKEITSKEKIYFYDLGVRNSLIAQFNPLHLRADVGALWENFCVVERLKYRQHAEMYGHKYFWRTHDQTEIDYIEDYDGVLHGYEFKWKESKYAPPKAFLQAYPNSSIELIHNKNFWNFLVGNK